MGRVLNDVKVRNKHSSHHKIKDLACFCFLMESHLSDHGLIPNAMFQCGNTFIKNSTNNTKKIMN